jgi:hypothetical protein
LAVIIEGGDSAQFQAVDRVDTPVSVEDVPANTLLVAVGLDCPAVPRCRVEVTSIVPPIPMLNPPVPLPWLRRGGADPVDLAPGSSTQAVLVHNRFLNGGLTPPALRTIGMSDAYLPHDIGDLTLTVTAWSSGVVVGTRRFRLSGLDDGEGRYASVNPVD